MDLLILGIGISEKKNDGVLRFEYFCNYFNLPYYIIGNGEKWQGGDLSKYAGGGQKVISLFNFLEKIDNKLIIMCDTFDLVPLGKKEEIIDKYNKISNGEVLISSEYYCWPDKDYESLYPYVKTKYKFLNSGCIMGYRNDLYKLIKNMDVKNDDDDQLFYTKKYINGEKIKLDYNCELFQTMYGVIEDLEIKNNRVYNKYTNTYPVFIHGNGSSKKDLNNLISYINMPLNEIIYKPKIFFALYVDTSKTYALELFLENIRSIKYENKIIYIYDQNDDDNIKNIWDKNMIYKKEKEYTFKDFKNTDCEYYFLVEQNAIIKKEDIMDDLLRENKRIIAPLIKGKLNTAYTNFWGEIDNNGYYKRSENYFDLIEYKEKGTWNVPYISSIILIHKSIIEWDLGEIIYNDREIDLCYNLRKNTLFMYMINKEEYGFLMEH